MVSINKNSRRIYLFLFFLFLFSEGSSQANKVQEAVAKYTSGALDEGILLMKEVTQNDPTDKNYNMLIEMHYFRYEFVREVNSGMADESKRENLGIGVNKTSHTNSSVCFDELIAECRNAGLYSKAPKASQILRDLAVTHVPDSNLLKEAREAYGIAEKNYKINEYKKCIAYCFEALNSAPLFYEANLYLGLSYQNLKNNDSAIYFFRKAIEICPHLLEPRKYLVESLGNAKNIEAAIAECQNAFCIYPDESIFMLYDVLWKRQKTFERHWIARGCEVNRVNVVSKNVDDGYWKTYQSAKKKIEKHCNDKGVIVSKRKYKKAGYMEVYCWKKMLSQKKKLPDEFKFAKKMEAEGYLDCYVFISMFHYDCYGQYQEFAKENKEKIKKYIETYLTK